MILAFAILVVGFYVLIKGADLLVAGATALARRFEISDLAIGLTVVAFGTSCPELFVNLTASAKGSAGI
ncbi:MAG: sodium:calcium antiporter, partial [Deltaproteobacteria bacterium]|nr:sodium:calcium antiporter [Deltaproteobacteria bacterium]